MGESRSTSNCRINQARRLDVRYKNARAERHAVRSYTHGTANRNGTGHDRDFGKTIKGRRIDQRAHDPEALVGKDVLEVGGLALVFGYWLLAIWLLANTITVGGSSRFGAIRIPG